MTHEEQVKCLKKIYDLQKLLIDKQNEISELSNQSFKPKPAPPNKPQMPNYNTEPYPKPESNMKFGEYLKTVPIWLWIILVFAMAPLGHIALIIYKYFEFKKAKEADVERIKHSESYINCCKAVDAENLRRKQEAENAYSEYVNSYNNELEKYNNETLPLYEDELKIWTDNHNKKLHDLAAVVDNASNELASHYESTKLLPIQYRNIEAIEYIYHLVSSSDDYDTLKAIESYDKKVSRDLEKQRIEQQRIANEKQEKANELALLNAQLANEQNDLLAEQNYIADRARKEANAAELLGAVQRHKTNKILKDRLK